MGVAFGAGVPLWEDQFLSRIYVKVATKKESPLILTKTLTSEEVLKAVAYFITQNVDDDFEGSITCKFVDDESQEVEVYIVSKDDSDDKVLH